MIVIVNGNLCYISGFLCYLLVEEERLEGVIECYSYGSEAEIELERVFDFAWFWLERKF